MLDKADFVIDTIWEKEIDHELSIIKPGRKLLSLIAGPNRQFAVNQKLPLWKQCLFGIVGTKLDKKAKNMMWNIILFLFALMENSHRKSQRL